MGSEWTKCPLSSIADIQTGPFGSQLHASDYVLDGIPSIMPQNIGDNRIHESGIARITIDDANRLEKYRVKTGDIVYSRRGDVELRALVREKENGWLCGTGCLRVRISTPKVDPIYASFYLSTSWSRAWIVQHAQGATMPNLNTSILGEVPFAYPDIKTQNSIAAILSSLDDKIELNNRIIANLEAQAQAIFKSWFVDFEPFQDGEFEESELGLIPKGWKVARLGELCDSVSITHDFKKRELIFLNTGDIDQGRFLHTNYSAVDLMPGQAKKSIKTDDILYSEIRPINKHFAYVNFDSEDYVVSTKLMVIRSKKIDSRRLYQFLTKQDILEELQVEAEARSGTFPQIRFENIQRMRILLATEEIEKKYCAMLGTFYQAIDQRNKEKQQLILVRDTLLPKLLSGEIEVPVEG